MESRQREKRERGGRGIAFGKSNRAVASNGNNVIAKERDF